MEINADFSKRAAVHAGRMDWVASPMPGVKRRMLDRIGDEVARATSIVNYAPESHFSAHTHTGGEEFLVLEGVFQDEHGDFPAGTYVRNPPTSSHTPGSDKGCTIFVKLWQFDPDDRRQLSIDTNEANWIEDLERDGVSTLPLYGDDQELVAMEIWEPGTSHEIECPSGLEALVLEGSFEESQEEFSYQSWLRLPKGSRARITSGENGCKLWIKRHHLSKPPQPPGV